MIWKNEGITNQAVLRCSLVFSLRLEEVGSAYAHLGPGNSHKQICRSNPFCPDVSQVTVNS